MKKLYTLLVSLLVCAAAAAATDTPDTLVVARDGSGKFRTPLGSHRGLPCLHGLPQSHLRQARDV